MRILDRPACYCRVPTEQWQYEVPTVSLVPSQVVRSYYSGLVLNESADGKTRLWTAAVAKYIFIVRLTLVMNCDDGACTTHYSHCLRFDHGDGSVPFCLPVKMRNTLKYFGLYKFAQRMCTDPVLTAMAFHSCFEVNWEKTAVNDDFVSYDFSTGEVYWLEKASVPAFKRIREEDGAPHQFCCRSCSSCSVVMWSGLH